VIRITKTLTAVLMYLWLLSITVF